MNLYEGIVFQLIGVNDKNKSVIAKGGRYDELVRSFSPNEKIFNGIGFTISVDILRNLIKEEKTDKKKILLMFKDSYLLEKGMNEQKVQQKKGNIAVLHLNPCDAAVGRLVVIHHYLFDDDLLFRLEIIVAEGWPHDIGQ